MKMITAVPNVIWSAVIASILTFVGVMWTNRGHAQLQRELLLHESERFRFEQNMSLKKEVFLDAAASFSKVLMLFSRLSDLNFSDRDIKEVLSEHGPAVAKIQLVAKEETVEKILAFSNDLSETYLSMLKPRAILLDHKSAIEIYEGMINDSENEKERIISIMKELNLQGGADQSTFEFLQSSYETQDQYKKETKENINEHRSILTPLHKEFAEKCISEYGRLSISIAPVTIAARQELDNDTDSELFENAINQSMAQMKDAFGKFLSNIDNEA